MKKKRPFDTSLLSGTWKGEYTYGDGYELELVGLSSSFRMELEFEEEQCRGICIDEENEGLLPGPITIEGVFHDNNISFIKKYPCRVDGDAEGNSIVYPDQPGHSIHYTGSLRRRGLTFYFFFEGSWDLTSLLPDEQGNLITYTCSGTWSMRLS